MTWRFRPDPRKAPQGKLPHLIADGRKIADSELIVEYLNDVTEGRVFAGLSARDRALGLATSRLVDDHLYWIFVASRWLDEEWFPNIIEGFFHIAPRPVRGFIARQARKEVEQIPILARLGSSYPGRAGRFCSTGSAGLAGRRERGGLSLWW